MVRKTSLSLLLFLSLWFCQSYGQAERDTMFYEIQPDMIQEAKIEKLTYEEAEETEYRIFVNLKEGYHSEYEQLTKENSGNYLAIVYKGEIVSPYLPVIQVAVPNARFSLTFKKEEQAKKVMQQIGVR